MSPSSPYQPKSSKPSPKTNESFGLIFDISHEYMSESGSSFRKEVTVVHVVGEAYFSLLKVILKRPILGLVEADRLDFTDQRSNFYRIKRIKLNEIPKGSESVLEEQLTKLVVSQEKQKFVNFFNQAKPITIKLHQLKLLPGVGQKRMWDIIEARKKGEFESFKDIEERTGLISVPVLVNRILEELTSEEKYNLFTK